MFLVFKNYTFLWDPSSEDYLKRDKRPLALKDFARQLEEEGLTTKDDILANHYSLLTRSRFTQLFQWVLVAD